MTSHIPVRRNYSLYEKDEIGANVSHQQKYVDHKQGLPESLW